MLQKGKTDLEMRRVKGEEGGQGAHKMIEQLRLTYLSVSGCGRHRLPRVGRSRVSGFLSSLHPCMFRYLKMCTLPFRQI